MNIKDVFKQYIKESNFLEASLLVKSLSYEDLSKSLMSIGFDNQNILGYVFINYLITKKETAELHSIACDILSSGLCLFWSSKSGHFLIA